MTARRSFAPLRRAAGAALLASLAGVAAAGEPARDAARKATELSGLGRWEEAYGILRDAQTACPAGETGRNCRLIASYNLGYACAEQARRDIAKSASLFEEAERHYRAVLGEAPLHVPTLLNLARTLQSRGKPDEAITALQPVMRDGIEGEEAASLALLLGDLYQRRKTPKEASEAYRRALDLAPASASVRRRVVDTSGPGVDLSWLMDRLANWEQDTPDVAALGYAKVAGSLPAEDPNAERALLSWVGLQSGQGRLDAERLDDLRASAGGEPVAALAEYLKMPERPPAAGTWWMRSLSRRDTLAQAALATGRRRLAGGNTREAVACWVAGERIAPPYDAYAYSELRSAPCTRLDLHTELAVLYSGRPDLDPDGRRFRETVSEVFGGKGMMYELRDLEGILRFHTVLGVIFSKREEWTGGPPFWNATFQLTRAIETAQRIEKETGHYRPMADIRTLQVRADQATGRKEDAARHAFEAAIACLDADDLRGAREMLETARSGGAAAPAAGVAKLSEILSLRGSAGRHPARPAPRPPGAGPRPDVSKPAVSPPSLSADAGSGLPESFLRRQRFKMLADEPELSGQEALSALELTAGDGFSLVGTSDLLRLRRVAERIGQGLGMTVAPPRVSAAAASRPAGGRRVKLSPAGPRAGRFVELSEEIVVASRIAGLIGLDKGVGLGISNGRVSVKGWGDVQDRKGFLAAVAGVPGVRSVRERQ